MHNILNLFETVSENQRFAVSPCGSLDKPLENLSVTEEK
jgi:hypothetical protein